MKSFIAFIILASIFTNQTTAQAQNIGPEKPPIKIGAILILSGEGAAQGTNSRRGATLAEEEINASGGVNGREIQIIYEDEVGANAQHAVAAYKKLTSENEIKYFLGPQWLNEVLAVAPIALKDKVFLLIPSTCSAKLPENTFCTWANPEKEVAHMAQYMIKKYKRVVAFGSQEPWETLCLEGFRKSFTELGGTVVEYLQPTFDAGDVRSEALKTKEAKPDAIFSSSYVHFVKYLKELKKLQVKAPFYGIELDQSLIDAAGNISEGVINVTPTFPNPAFAEKMRKRFNANPDVPAPQAYDAIYMIAEAIKKNGEGYENMVRYFQSFGTYSGATGNIQSQNGKAIVPTALYLAHDSHWERVPE